MKIILLLAIVTVSILITIPVIAQSPTLVVQTGHSSRVSAIDFSSDGRLIATASWDNTVKIWDFATQREIRSLEGHKSNVWTVAFSPDNRLIASGSDDKLVKIWETATGKEIITIDGHNGAVHALAFSPDGKMIAVGGDISLPTSGKAFNADMIDDTLEVYDVKTGKMLRKLDGFRTNVTGLEFSSDGRWLASAGFSYSDKGNVVRVWEVKKWKLKRTFANRPSDLYINALAFSPDGRYIASAGKDKEVIINDVVSGQEIRRMQGHSKTITSLAYSPDGSFIASGSEDETLKLWNSVTGKQVRQSNEV